MPLGFCRTRSSSPSLPASQPVLRERQLWRRRQPRGDADKLRIVQSQFDITVTNTAGKALFEVKAEIEPTGPASHFTTIIARMENGEKRVLGAQPCSRTATACRSARATSGPRA